MRLRVHNRADSGKWFRLPGLFRLFPALREAFGEPPLSLLLFLFFLFLHHMSHSSMFFNEWVSLQFLRQVMPEPPLVPHLYGGDQQLGLLVMEDVQPSVRLDQLLLGTDPRAAEAGLLAYAELHGRLHVLAADRQADYLRFRERLGPAVSPDPYYTYRWLPMALREITALLEVPVSRALRKSWRL